MSDAYANSQKELRVTFLRMAHEVRGSIGLFLAGSMPA
jgi:hypothetical protein